MQRSEFHFNLPPALIAQQPLENRADSRLLCLDGKSGTVSDRMFRDLPELISPDDLLVFNDTRVIPARLFGRKESGGRVEILVERILEGGEVLAQVKASKTPRPGTNILLQDGSIHAVVKDRQDDLFRLQFDSATPVLPLLEKIGHIPLPPYISRQDTPDDFHRYQTVYAKREGAVAAPTAGLHFDEDMLDLLKTRGVNMQYVTLHVGAGTFQPVRVDNLEEHHMHSEYAQVSQQVCDEIKKTRDNGGKVVAVGTTSLRALETASLKHGEPVAFEGETDIFIYPGVPVRCVDALITNFHLPESTLLMLVSALAGKENIFHAYQHAINEGYRFFSYGDAMFIDRQ